MINYYIKFFFFFVQLWYFFFNRAPLASAPSFEECTGESGDKKKTENPKEQPKKKEKKIKSQKNC